MLDEYIQQQYQIDKQVLYHRIQEIPKSMVQSLKAKQQQQLQSQDSDSDKNDFDEDEDEDRDDDEGVQNSSKSYTVCIIVNPQNMEELFKDWKLQNDISGK